MNAFFHRLNIINYSCLLRTNMIMRQINSLLCNLTDCIFIIADLCNVISPIKIFGKRPSDQGNLMDENFFNDLYEEIW